MRTRGKERRGREDFGLKPKGQAKEITATHSSSSIADHCDGAAGSIRNLLGCRNDDVLETENEATWVFNQGNDDVQRFGSAVERDALKLPFRPYSWIIVARPAAAAAPSI
jgi:hypothetical protein